MTYPYFLVEEILILFAGLCFYLVLPFLMQILNL